MDKIDDVLPADVAEPIARGANSIRAIREWRGLQPQELAELAHIEVLDLAKIEAGTEPTADQAARLAKALRVTDDWMTGWL